MRIACEPLIEVARNACSIYGWQSYISQITPRSDYANQCVRDTNYLLGIGVGRLEGQINVHIIKHEGITKRHLHDDRHLKRMIVENDQLPATLMLGANFYKSLSNGMPPANALLLASVRNPSYTRRSNSGLAKAPGTSNSSRSVQVAYRSYASAARFGPPAPPSFPPLRASNLTWYLFY